MLAHHYVSALELTRAAGGETRPRSNCRPGSRCGEAGKPRVLPERARVPALEVRGPAHSSSGPRMTPGYPRLLVDLGYDPSPWLRAEGTPELQEAADQFLLPVTRQVAAEAEANLGDVYPFQRPAAAVARAPQTARSSSSWTSPKTRVHGPGSAPSRGVPAVLAGEGNFLLEESKRILALAEEFGTTEEILMARITFGPRRFLERLPGKPPSGIVWSAPSSSPDGLTRHLVGRACVQPRIGVVCNRRRPQPLGPRSP